MTKYNVGDRVRYIAPLGGWINSIGTVIWAEDEWVWVQVDGTEVEMFWETNEVERYTPPTPIEDTDNWLPVGYTPSNFLPGDCIKNILDGRSGTVIEIRFAWLYPGQLHDIAIVSTGGHERRWDASDCRHCHIANIDENPVPDTPHPEKPEPDWIPDFNPDPEKPLPAPPHPIIHLPDPVTPLPTPVPSPIPNPYPAPSPDPEPVPEPEPTPACPFVVGDHVRDTRRGHVGIVTAVEGEIIYYRKDGTHSKYRSVCGELVAYTPPEPTPAPTPAPEPVPPYPAPAPDPEPVNPLPVPEPIPVPTPTPAPEPTDDGGDYVTTLVVAAVIVAYVLMG